MAATFKKIEITQQFLDNNPDAYFVFGDNIQRQGTAGAAKLRGHKQALGFITKKYPANKDQAYFRPAEYASLFFEQLDKLEEHIKANPNFVFYISKLGSGLANRHRIWELVIKHNLLDTLTPYNNVVFCWEEHEDDFQ